jgi:predicted metal-dependent HD superfamily phosphohydrolase
MSLNGNEGSQSSHSSKLSVAPAFGVPESLRVAWQLDLGSHIDASTCLANLVSRYSEAHRSYHGVAHVFSVLNHLPPVLETEGFALDSRVAQSLRLALWYHDAIYEVHSETNEADSAALAVRELTALGLEDSQCTDVSRLVMATKHPSEPHSADEAIIVDVDLGILAASAENYDRYVSRVRQEYSFVSDEGWRVGRMKVLRSFLEADRIFHTKVGKSWEPQAVENMQRELSSITI